MPEVVLAGPDGKPAVDAQTGMALTMEELLRRRGMIGYSGQMRNRPLDPYGTVTNNNEGSLSPDATPVVATNDPANGGVNGADGPIAGSDGVTVGQDGTNGPPPVPGLSKDQLETLTDNDIEGLKSAELSGLAVAGTATAAAAYLAWKALRNRGGTAVVDAVAPTGTALSAATSSNAGVIDGDYTVVSDQKRIGRPNSQITATNNQGIKAIGAPSEVALGGAQPSATARALTTGRRVNATNRAATAAQGAANRTVIAAHPKVNTKVESPIVGVLRTIGLPEAAAQQLAKNKGLLRQLGRAIR